MRHLRDGIVAGLLAGATLAALFYFYDLGQGAALRTPTFLWGALTGDPSLEPSTGVVAAYTLLHFAVWGALGAFASILIRRWGLGSNALVGAAYGLFVCSVVFYAGLILGPTDALLQAPAWPAVFFGNALAGVIIFSYLHWRGSEPGVFGMVEFLKAHDTTREGLVAGAIGAAVVAGWFLVIDLVLRGQALYTPAALGTALFEGATSPADVVISLETVLGYTLVHIAFFLLAGVVISGLMEQAERFPPLAYGLVILFVVFEVFFVAMTIMLGRWVLADLAWWAVLAGNVLAALSMGAYLWRRHPSLGHKIDEAAGEAAGAEA